MHRQGTKAHMGGEGLWEERWTGREDEGGERKIAALFRSFALKWKSGELNPSSSRTK